MHLGTRLFTWWKGEKVGTDRAGNRYYREKRPRAGMRARRWVIYAGEEEATRVPPEWHAWLHYTIDAPLPEAKPHPWVKEHEPNRTGTVTAYRPPGHQFAGGERAAATGDYEPWKPG